MYGTSHAAMYGTSHAAMYGTRHAAMYGTTAGCPCWVRHPRDGGGTPRRLDSLGAAQRRWDGRRRWHTNSREKTGRAPPQKKKSWLPMAARRVISSLEAVKRQQLSAGTASPTKVPANKKNTANKKKQGAADRSLGCLDALPSQRSLSARRSFGTSDPPLPKAPVPALLFCRELPCQHSLFCRKKLPCQHSFF